MAIKTHSKRYAEAVFAIAKERQELDKWQSDLEKIAELGENETLIDVLENPKLHFNDKAKLISEILGDISPMALNLANLLIAKGRLNTASDISIHFEQMLDAYRGIERADVVTAVPLDDDDKLRLEARLGKIVNKKVTIEQAVDPDLLGGIVARMGGKLLDGSVRSKLENLKKEISYPR